MNDIKFLIACFIVAMALSATITTKVIDEMRIERKL